MKKTFLFVIVLSASVASFCQQTQPTHSLTGKEYLQKAKKQNTAAWIVLGSGFALTTAGIITGINGTAAAISGAFTGEKSKTFEAGAILFYTGLAAMVGSIPLFVVSSINKKHGMSLSLQNKPIPFLSKQSIVAHSIPSLTLKVNL